MAKLSKSPHVTNKFDCNNLVSLNNLSHSNNHKLHVKRLRIIHSGSTISSEKDLVAKSTEVGTILLEKSLPSR